jgi:hypothetical protein
MANRDNPTIKDMKLLSAMNLRAADVNRKFGIAAFDAYAGRTNRPKIHKFILLLSQES